MYPFLVEHYSLDLLLVSLSFIHLFVFHLRMCCFDSIVSLGVELDNQAFD